jgi:hypothetical protein
MHMISQQPLRPARINMRVAVVGLFRSGSSFWAKCLHRLGVDMGDHFWENSMPDHPDNHCEALHLAAKLREIWDEPSLVSRVSRTERVRALREWIDGRGTSRRAYGAKHPLLSMSIDELREAWGDDTAIIWCSRPLEDSIASLHATNFPWRYERGAAVQNELWTRLQADFAVRAPFATLEFASMADPLQRKIAIQGLVEKLKLPSTVSQIANANAAYMPVARRDRVVNES